MAVIHELVQCQKEIACISEKLWNRTRHFVSILLIIQVQVRSFNDSSIGVAVWGTVNVKAGQRYGVFVHSSLESAFRHDDPPAKSSQQKALPVVMREQWDLDFLSGKRKIKSFFTLIVLIKI